MSSKRASDLRLGDRIAIPGTSITTPVTFLWHFDSMVMVGMGSDARIWPASTEVRVSGEVVILP